MMVRNDALPTTLPPGPVPGVSLPTTTTTVATLPAASSRLSSVAFKALISVLENVEQPLGDLCSLLWSFQIIALESTQLSIALSIAALLQDDLLPKPPQRLVAIYMLYHMIVSRHIPDAIPAIDKLVASPFTIILFEAAGHGVDQRLTEQLFLSHLLTHSQKADPTVPSLPAQISQAPAATLWNALEGAMRSGAAVPKLNISSVQAMWVERHPAPLPSATLWLQPVSAVVLDADNKGDYSQQQQQQQREEEEEEQQQQQSHQLIDELDTVVSLEDFTPSFVRIPPPVLPIDTAAELRWADPEVLHVPVWDSDMGQRVRMQVDLKDILSKAYKSPIPESLQMRAVQYLEQDARLIYACGLSPRKLPELTENNAGLAAKLLHKLFRLDDRDVVTAYLRRLSDMDVNQHSMEVVTKLSTLPNLPHDFLHGYISKCIQQCSDRQPTRMVRNVCTFLKNLMVNKSTDVQAHHIEVQRFCMDFSRIREVADLFRSLKHLGVQQ